MAEGDIYLGIDPSDRGFNAVALQDDKVIGHWCYALDKPLGSELGEAIREVILGCWAHCHDFEEPPIIVSLEAVKHMTPGMSWPQLCPTMRIEGAITYCLSARFAINPVLMTRGEIKLELLNNPRGKDGDVRAYLLQDIGEVGTKKKPGPCYGLKADDWAALAAARALQNQDKRTALMEAKSA